MEPSQSPMRQGSSGDRIGRVLGRLQFAGQPTLSDLNRIDGDPLDHDIFALGAFIGLQFKVLAIRRGASEYRAEAAAFADQPFYGPREVYHRAPATIV